MFETESEKLQDDVIPSPAGLDPAIIVSPDTRRPNRIPPGQSRTRKWPVLDASGPPRLNPAEWRLQLSGLVHRPVTLTLAQFEELPRVRVFSDFHCVTRWSRLGNLWEGVAVREALARVGGPAPGARFALIHASDSGWTTNLPLEFLLAEDALLATHHDGQPLSIEHGGPVRLVVPSLYAWKSAKWIQAIELLDHDRAGFWERNGYHMLGDPWREERFGGY